MDFMIWKFIHILAVIIFLGNIITGFYWQSHGEKQANHQALLSTFQGLHRSDLWITNPCIVAIIMSGLGMGYSAGMSSLFQNWLLVAYLLMTVSGIAYALKLMPLTHKIITLLNTEHFNDQHWKQYFRLKNEWRFWALSASVVPFIVFALMFFRPELTLNA